MRSCVTPVGVPQGVTTIEGLSRDRRRTRSQKAWVELNVPQCGYCQAGRSWPRRRC